MRPLTDRGARFLVLCLVLMWVGVCAIAAPWLPAAGVILTSTVPAPGADSECLINSQGRIGAATTCTVNSGTGAFSFSNAVYLTALALTNGTPTLERQAGVRDALTSYTWTNANVAALGAVTTGDMTIATLPAKTKIRNVLVGITGAGAGVTTLQVSCGVTAAGYIDYVVKSDAKTQAIYGDASGERGTNLTGYHLPSYVGTTPFICQFVSTGANLSAVTGSTGRVIIESTLYP